MQFLYFLEKIRNPVLDFLMSTITFVGGEAVFLAIAIVLIWCTEKRYGYFTLLTCFFGTVINQMLKLTFRIPRPWEGGSDGILLPLGTYAECHRHLHHSRSGKTEKG